MERLRRAFERSKELEIDGSSRIIIFSDCHRGDNSISDEFAHNQTIFYYALRYYYENGFTYIELGDGDELWEHKKFKHIRYAHSDIFWLLEKYHKENRLHMVVGNHNIEFEKKLGKNGQGFKFYDEYIERYDTLFEGLKIDDAIILKHKEKDGQIFMAHGHQGDILNDHLWILARFMMRYFWRFMHIIGFRNPSSPAKNIHKRARIEKKLMKWAKENNQIMIAGHTHRARFPRPDEPPYFNDGCCIHPRNITGIEIKNDHIMLVDWRVRTRGDGEMYIARRVIRGPEKLETYFEKYKGIRKEEGSKNQND